jgi:hypothetical protein
MSKLLGMPSDHPLPGPARSGDRDAVRIGDRERAAAADRLSAHAAAGRLSVDELEARLDRVHRAVLARDLRAVEADLPGGGARRPPAPPFAALPLACLAAAVLLTVAVGHPVLPLFAAAFLLWRFGLPLPRRSWS